MIEAITVSTVHDDACRAGREAAEELLDRLGGQPDAVLVFAAIRYRPEQLLEGLWSRLSDRVALAGCSSYAEINADECLSDSVTVMGMRLGGISAAAFHVAGVDADSQAAGAALGREARGFGADLLIALPDGLANGTRFLLGLQAELGQRFPIVGGMAAGDATYSQTYQLCGRRALTGGAAALALKGPVELVTHARSGWIPIGATRTCTRVEEGNLLVELDGRPALDLYEDYLGDRAKEMPGVSPQFPIGLVGGIPSSQKMPGEQILLLRGIKSVDRERRAIRLGGDIPEGGEVRMTRATRDDVIQGADEAGARVHELMPDPSIALFFDCAARKMVLGHRYKDEVKATFSRLGQRVPKIGFYTYGELSPVQEVTMHHEATFTVAFLKG